MTSNTRKIIYSLIAICATMIAFNSASYAINYEATCDCGTPNPEFNDNKLDVYTIEGKPDTTLSVTLNGIRVGKQQELLTKTDLDYIMSNTLPTLSKKLRNLVKIISPLYVSANCSGSHEMHNMWPVGNKFTCNKGEGIDINLCYLGDSGKKDYNLQADFTITEENQGEITTGDNTIIDKSKSPEEISQGMSLFTGEKVAILE